MHYSYQPYGQDDFLIVSGIDRPKAAFARVQSGHKQIQRIVESLSAHDELLALLAAVEPLQQGNRSGEVMGNISSAADAARIALKLAKY